MRPATWPSQLSKRYHRSICHSQRAPLLGSIHYRECGWRICRERRALLHSSLQLPWWLCDFRDVTYPPRLTPLIQTGQPRTFKIRLYSIPPGYQSNELDGTFFFPLHFDLYRESCYKNKGIVVIIPIELFGNDHLDGALRYRAENSTKSSRGQLPSGNYTP